MSIESDPILGYRSFNLTSRVHKEAYAAISPSRPELSQAGKTVLVTGASGGIGLEIARSFGVAGAAKVILTGSHQGRIQDATESLQKDDHGGTIFEGRICDVKDPTSIDSLWDDLEAAGIRVDVLVLNALAPSPRRKLLQLGWKQGWADWEANVRSNYHFTDRFHNHARPDTSKRYICNVSTSAIHDWKSTDSAPNYGLTKNAGTLLMQQVAREVAVSDTQIISFHPGAILTPGAQKLGLNETSLHWDNSTLPASFAVWAASPEAEFLHGRFVCASWDVEELGAEHLRERLESDGNFLRIGVNGLDACSV